jgi:hypothetical protein
MKKLFLVLVMLVTASFCFEEVTLKDLKDSIDWFQPFFNKGNYIIIMGKETVQIIPKTQVAKLKWDEQLGELTIYYNGDSMCLENYSYKFEIEDKTNNLLATYKTWIQKK